MKDKVIHREQLQFEDKEAARLSYDMVFDESREEVDEETRRLMEQTKEEWEKKLVRERQQAIEEGYKAGYKDGYEKAKQETEEQITPVKQALEQVEQRLSTFTEEIKPALTSLVFELAEKVITVPVENEELKNQVTTAVQNWLTRLHNEQQIQVYVSEADYESIRFLMDEQKKGVQLTTTPDLNPGEFHIETNHHAVIQNFKKHLANIRSKSDVKEAIIPPDA